MNAPPMAVVEGPIVGPSPSVPVKSTELPKLNPLAALRLGKCQTRRDLVSSLPLLLLDVLATVTSMACAYAASSLAGHSGVFSKPIFAFGTLALTLLFQHIHGLYPACGLTYSIEYRRVLRTCLMVSCALAAGLLARADVYGFPLLEWFTFAIATVLLLGTLRSLARHFLGVFDWWAQPVIIVGDSPRALSLYDRMDRTRHEGLRPLGLVFESRRQWMGNQSLSQKYLGPLEELEELLLQTGTCRVAVPEAHQLQLQDYHSFHGIPHVMLPTDLTAHPCERARLSERDGCIELHCHFSLTNSGSLFAKRTMDLVFVLISLAVWLPLMLGIALSIKLTDSGPVFYRQARVGRFGRPFHAIKFRSMVLNADSKLSAYLDSHPELRAEWEETHKLQNDPRVTRIGKLLRQSSLDELPQLINVLRGEMSLVGPRPIIDGGEYDSEYIQGNPDVFELYQLVRPGITGLWQVSGRNTLPYTQRVALDRYYLHNWCLTLDIFILWRTVKTAILREGAF